jgi:hypothetical protein
LRSDTERPLSSIGVKKDWKPNDREPEGGRGLFELEGKIELKDKLRARTEVYCRDDLRAGREAGSTRKVIFSANFGVYSFTQ